MKVYRYMSFALLLQQMAMSGAVFAQETPTAPEVPSLTDTLKGMPKADYVSGKILYEDGDFAGALVKFESAYRASNDPRLLWNVAVCHKALRHYAEVLRLLRVYEKDAGAYLSADDKEDVSRLMTAIVPLVSSVNVSGTPADAEVFLDGVSVGRLPLTAPLLVDIGKRQVSVKKSGYKEFTQALEISGDEKLNVSVTLEKVVTQGTLIVRAGQGDRILVDGKAVGTGTWQGKLSRGAHSLTVRAEGKRSFNAEITIEPGRTRTVTAELEAEASGGLPTWLWVTGGVLVAGGAAASGYLIFGQSDSTSPQRPVGTIKPGTVHLP
ncbi:MAG: PEGA domain-containing protein [Polyangiaceae bacterium]|nr:PEGA domain-containing protein [Polyangiaceae bacterium]